MVRPLHMRSDPTSAMTDTSTTEPSSTPSGGGLPTYAVQRTNMVDTQVRPSDITDRRIIRAMLAVPREEFVPALAKVIAYMDNPVVVDRGPPARTLVEPRLFAKLVQLADIPDGGRVLEVGSGTGYGTAVLAAMGCKAFGLEENAALATLARDTHARLGTAAETKTGPFAAGLAADGPFDAIVLSGSVSEVPPALFDQLKNGACLVAVTGSGPASKARVWIRTGTLFSSRDAFDATAALLPGLEAKRGFVF